MLIYKYLSLSLSGLESYGNMFRTCVKIHALYTWSKTVLSEDTIYVNVDNVSNSYLVKNRYKTLAISEGFISNSEVQHLM